MTGIQSLRVRLPSAQRTLRLICALLVCNVVLSPQLTGDNILLDLGHIFIDPEGVKKEGFYRYSERALDNVRRSVQRRQATAPAKEPD